MLKKILFLFLIFAAVFSFYAWRAWYTSLPMPFLPSKDKKLSFRIERITTDPIIHDQMAPSLVRAKERFGYTNINGPTMIRVPDWVKDPLGQYYLYFAHNRGKYIRLAYADQPTGPWTIHEPGSLQLEFSYFSERTPDDSALETIISLYNTRSSTEFWTLLRVGLKARKDIQIRKARGEIGSDERDPHIASPDVIIDDQNEEIRIYFHGLVEDATQLSRVGISSNGIKFTVLPKIISAPYLRVFALRGIYYGIAMPGLLYRSPDGIRDFEVRPKPLAGSDMRHTGLWLEGDTLYVFWTRVGDSPERILCSSMNVGSNDWGKWRLSEPVEVLRPELTWEGANLPSQVSLRGELTRRVNQLRDPFIFLDEDQAYLLYSGAGEDGIGITSIEITH
jgi:hypothetical protein